MNPTQRYPETEAEKTNMADKATEIPLAKSCHSTYNHPHQHKLHESIDDSYHTEYHAGWNAQLESKQNMGSETDLNLKPHHLPIVDNSPQITNDGQRKQNCLYLASIGNKPDGPHHKKHDHLLTIHNVH